jgi:predicted Zn-dependent protease
MGSVPATTLQALAAFYLDKYGLRVAILKPAPINAASRDVGRRQLIGEELVTAMRSAYPKAAADPNAVLIGIVSEDLYVRVRPDWAWAFGLRTDGRFGVLSTARMSWPQGLASKTVQMTRLRKMVTRYIGQLYFRLPTNNVQGSVLYGTINGLYDLDRLGEDF